MQESPVQFLGQEDPLEKEYTTTPVFLGFPCGSAGKESTCNAGVPSSIPGSGRSAGEGARLPTPVFLGFPCGSAGKESAGNAGDLGLIPGLGRSPGEGKGYPFQYSGLENSMEYIVHGVAKSRTRLSNSHLFSLSGQEYLFSLTSGFISSLQTQV